MTDDLPDLILFAKVEEAFALLGLPVEDTISVTFGTDHVEVVSIRTTTSGHALAAGDDLATVTTTIGYLRTAKADL